MSPSALYRATESISEEDLRWMVLEHNELGTEFADFPLLREGVVDNDAMAEQDFGERTPADLRATGRITGYLREFATGVSPEALVPGSNLAAATAVHIFDHDTASSRWMTEVFLRDFEQNVGREMAPGQQLVSAKRFSPAGLWDESTAIRVVQQGSHGLVSSTVVDFRLGRLLGVAFVVSFGDCRRKSTVERLAQVLERKMVQVMLDAV